MSSSDNVCYIIYPEMKAIKIWLLASEDRFSLKQLWIGLFAAVQQQPTGVREWFFFSLQIHLLTTFKKKFAT